MDINERIHEANDHLNQVEVLIKAGRYDTALVLLAAVYQNVRKVMDQVLAVKVSSNLRVIQNGDNVKVQKAP